MPLTSFTDAKRALNTRKCNNIVANTRLKPRELQKRTRWFM
jgi:hypothetical protein